MQTVYCKLRISFWYIGIFMLWCIELTPWEFNISKYVYIPHMAATHQPLPLFDVVVLTSTTTELPQLYHCAYTTSFHHHITTSPQPHNTASPQLMVSVQHQRHCECDRNLMSVHVWIQYLHHSVWRHLVDAVRWFCVPFSPDSVFVTRHSEFCSWKTYGNNFCENRIFWIACGFGEKKRILVFS